MKSLHKKIISALTIFIVVFSISLSGCNTSQLNASTETCDNGHNLVQSSYTSPTCKTNGEEVQRCTRCGFENKKTLLTIDHDYKVKSTTNSTCTVQGKTIYECTMCREAKMDILPCAAHSYVAKNEPRTCFTDGYDYNECSVCGDRQTTKTYPKLTHSFSSQNTTDYSRCVNCGVGSALYRVKKVDGYNHYEYGKTFRCYTAIFEIDRPTEKYTVPVPEVIEAPKNYFLAMIQHSRGHIIRESYEPAKFENGLPKMDYTTTVGFDKLTSFHFKVTYTYVDDSLFWEIVFNAKSSSAQNIPTNEYPTVFTINFTSDLCQIREI